MASRCNAVIEGLRYILGHPLLPGLYALDWGMTAVSYYRELFPLFVAELFISGRFGEPWHAISPKHASIKQQRHINQATTSITLTHTVVWFVGHHDWQGSTRAAQCPH